jgi:hypothetical protein
MTTENEGGAAPADTTPTVEELQAQLAERDQKIAELSKAANPAESAAAVAPQASTDFAKIQEEIEALKSHQTAEKEKLTAQLEQVKTKMLDEITKGDATLKERVTANFNRLSDPTDTPEQVQAKMLDAYKLSTDAPLVSPFALGYGSNNPGLKPSNQDKQTFDTTEQGLNLAKKLNLKFAAKKPEDNK